MSTPRKRFIAVALLAGMAFAVPAFGESQPEYLLKWGITGTTPGRFRWPWTVSVNGAGEVYVADYYNGRVQKFDSNGTFLTEWPTGTSQWGSVYGTHQVAFGPDGTIYVATTYWKINKYSSDGVFSGYIESGVDQNGFGLPTGLAVDASGNIYVVDSYHGRVEKLASDGSPITNWGTAGAGPGQLASPTGIAVDGSGRILVADTGNNRIQIFDANGNFLSILGGQGSAPGRFNFPTHLTVDGAGNIYVADMNNHRIQKFDSQGEFVVAWGGYDAYQNGKFRHPGGIAIAPDGSIFVSDSGNDRIQKFRPCTAGCQPPPTPCADGPKILLHVQNVTTKNACSAGAIVDCSGAVTEGDVALPGAGPFYNVYLLANIGSAHDVAGLQCGITYQDGTPGALDDGTGIDIFDWTLCASLEFPPLDEPAWPKPGSGNLMTWSRDQCQAGATALAGYFYLGAYSLDRLQLVPRPVDGLAKLANCSAVEIPLSAGDLGYASFSQGARLKGCNPGLVSDCLVQVPVLTTTWGGLKALYR